VKPPTPVAPIAVRDPTKVSRRPLPYGVMRTSADDDTASEVSRVVVRPKYPVPLRPKLKPMDHWDLIVAFDSEKFRQEEEGFHLHGGKHETFEKFRDRLDGQMDEIRELREQEEAERRREREDMLAQVEENRRTEEAEAEKERSKMDFMKKARSAKIEGTCPWIVCTKVNFKGHRVRLNPNTDYEILPHDLHRKIASLRVANPNMDNLQDIDQEDVTNTLDRLWAYLKIRNSLKPQSTSSEIQTASEAALEKGFLTPYTNFQWINQQNKSQSITFEDLNPVFFQVVDPEHERKFEELKDCTKPVNCPNGEEKFHYEESIEDNANSTCHGELTLYTKINFQGDALKTKNSLNQIYHKTNGEIIRSLKASGDCCWLLFEHRLYAQSMKRFCGNLEQVSRNGNIRSVKRMGQHQSNPAKNDESNATLN